MDVTIPDTLIHKVALNICPGPGVKLHSDGVTAGEHGTEAPCAWCRHDAYTVLHALAAAGELRQTYVVVASGITYPATSRADAITQARKTKAPAAARRQLTFAWLDEPTVRVVGNEEEAPT